MSGGVARPVDADRGAAPANRLRGEVAIRLGGRDYVLRPTFQALCEIETRTGRGIVALARRTAAGDVGVAETAAIVTAGLRAAGEPATFDTVGRLILEAGLAACVPAVTAFLTAALGGDPGRGDSGPGDSRLGDPGPGGTAECSPGKGA